MDQRLIDVLIQQNDATLDAGIFSLANNERITDMFIFPSQGWGGGFNLTTDTGRTYSALPRIVGDPIKMNVGSGIIGRIRTNLCDIGVLSATHFDFLDELESIGISDIAYSGFTDNILPAGSGQSITVGSQSIDNTRGSTEQTTSINTQDAVVKQRSVTVTDGFSVGGSISIQQEANIPFIAKSTVTAEANWQIQRAVVSKTACEETQGGSLIRYQNNRPTWTWRERRSPGEQLSP